MSRQRRWTSPLVAEREPRRRVRQLLVNVCEQALRFVGKNTAKKPVMSQEGVRVAPEVGVDRGNSRGEDTPSLVRARPSGIAPLR